MKLTSKQRNNLKKSEFALPDERKYPVDTKNRAKNAKARASEQYNKGNLNLSEKKEIDSKAEKKLKKSVSTKSIYKNHVEKY